MKVAIRQKTRILTIYRGTQTVYQAEWLEEKEKGWPWNRYIEKTWKPFVRFEGYDETEVRSEWPSRTAVENFLDKWHIANLSCCDIEYHEYPEGIVN